MVSMYWTIVTQHALPLPLVQTKRSCLTPFVTITSLIVTITIAGIVVVAVVAVVGVVGVVVIIVVGLRSLFLLVLHHHDIDCYLIYHHDQA